MPAVLIIPCFNEAKRLSIEEVETLMLKESLSLTFVDDGSDDGTRSMLENLRQRWDQRVQVIVNEQNCGKAESVRKGLLDALQNGATIAGYADADFSTPASELIRLLNIIETTGHKVVMGSRIRHLGVVIQRSAFRHYIGRVFATLAAMILKLPVYDTQCGAKWFKTSDTLRHSLTSPFRSRWAFDVELIGRLHKGFANQNAYAQDDFLEVPLNQWIDLGESKISLKDKLQILYDLTRIWLDLSSIRSSHIGDG